MTDHSLAIGHRSYMCGECGSSSFEIPDEPRADSLVSCKKCGAEARYGDVRGDKANPADGMRVHDSKPGPEVEAALEVVEELRRDLELEDSSTALLLFALLQFPSCKAAQLLNSFEGSLRARLVIELLEQTKATRNGISREHIIYVARRVAVELFQDSTIDSRHLLVTCLVGAGFAAAPSELPPQPTDTRFILGTSNTAVKALTYLEVPADAFLDQIRDAMERDQ